MMNQSSLTKKIRFFHPIFPVLQIWNNQPSIKCRTTVYSKYLYYAKIKIPHTYVGFNYKFSKAKDALLFVSRKLRNSQQQSTQTMLTEQDTISCPFYQLSSFQRVSVWASCQTHVDRTPLSCPGDSSSSGHSSSWSWLSLPSRGRANKRSITANKTSTLYFNHQVTVRLNDQELQFEQTLASLSHCLSSGLPQHLQELHDYLHIKTGWKLLRQVLHLKNIFNLPL